jgi:hypothetical protein
MSSSRQAQQAQHRCGVHAEDCRCAQPLLDCAQAASLLFG